MFVRNATWALLAFASVFFPRFLDTIGFPSLVNFVHFAIVPFVCGLILVTSPIPRCQWIYVKEILIGLGGLLTIIIASAILNNAGLINVVLNFLMLSEPYLMLITITALPLTPSRLQWYQTWVARFLYFHLFLVLVQRFVLRFDTLPPPAAWDYIQGVFFYSAGGHVIGAVVTCSYTLYSFVTRRRQQPKWLPWFLVMFSLFHIYISDTKQIPVIMFAAALLLVVLRLNDLGKAILYLLIVIAASSAFYWAITNLEMLYSYAYWLQPELYGPGGEVEEIRGAGIRVILSYFQSPLNWLIGLGPGHTVDRIGGWMMRDFRSMLEPLGATTSPVPERVWEFVGAAREFGNTSMFSPFFAWAGIWGNLGFLGLGTYLYLGWTVWRRFCSDDFSRFMVLNMALFGFIMTQMEEPGYTLFVATMVGLRWQEQKVIAQEEERLWYEYYERVREEEDAAYPSRSMNFNDAWD